MSDSQHSANPPLPPNRTIQDLEQLTASAACADVKVGRDVSVHLPVALLGCIFALVNLYFLVTSGVRTAGDGVWYVEVAGQQPEGNGVPEMLQSRLWYVGLIAICQASGLGLGAVVAVQLAAAAVACVALYDLGRTLGGPWAGVLAAATLAANPDIARYHWHILTDSLYISAAVVTVWSIHGKEASPAIGLGSVYAALEGSR